MSQPAYDSPAYSQAQVQPPPSYTLYWIGAPLLLVVYILALFIWPPIFTEIKGTHPASNAILFFGRFHPIAVHLPIGVIILTMLIELGSLRARFEEKWRDMALFCGFITAASAIVAVLFGIFLAREGGYKGGGFILHQSLGIGMTFGVIIALFLRLVAAQTGVRTFLDASRFFLFGSFGVMSLGAHFGGNISHGSNYLVEYAPPAIAKPLTATENWLMSFFDKKERKEPVKQPAPAPVVAKQDDKQPPATPSTPSTPNTPTPAPPSPGTPPTPAPANDKLVFQDIILPIFEAKCNKCHNADKSKGDLAMHTYEDLMKGGQDESVKSIVAGKPENSLVTQRIHLPESEDEHMPPEGKDQMTPEEIQVLELWIKAGASATQKVSEAAIPADVLKALHLPAQP